MAPDVSSMDTLAVAFVVESSITVGFEWRRLFIEYISPMLKRLTDTYMGYRLRCGFVTYGTQDAIPSPILCKRFFTDFQYVLREMNSDPSKLSIAQTDSGGHRGMAALEGLVAAIELFDTLAATQTEEQPHSLISHIFHVAASSPDTSKHPSWNDFPALDFVTWESLPMELKKRSIHFSCIILRQKIPRFTELHSATITGAPTAVWFNLRMSHSALLAGFAAPVQQKISKRVNESFSADGTPEVKRARLNQPVAEASPKLHSGSPLSSLEAHNTQAQAQNHPTPSSSSLGPRISQHQVIERFRQAEEHLHKLELSITTAKAMGNNELAENLSQDYAKQKENHFKFKQAITTYVQQQQSAARQQMQQAVSGNQSSENGSGPSATSSTSHIGSGLSNRDAQPIAHSGAVNDPISTDIVSTVNPPKSSDSQSSLQSLPNRSGFSQLPDGSVKAIHGAQPSAMIAGQARIPQMPNTVAAQIQKLIEQRGRPTNQKTGITPPSLPNHSPEGGPGTSTLGPISLQTGSSQSSDQSLAGNPKSLPVWSGILKWSGTGPNGKKDVQTAVVASTQYVSTCQAETWPQALNLIPTREPAVSLLDLQAWMKRYKPVLCTFQAQPRVSDSKVNESCYRSLVTLLTTKNIYAVAAWKLPSGEQKNNVLVFPINNLGLVGAFFPLAGIPEMPKSTSGQQPVLTQNSHAATVAQWQSMTPDQRAQIYALLRQRQQQASAPISAANVLLQQSSQTQHQPNINLPQDVSNNAPLGSNSNLTSTASNIPGLFGLMGNYSASSGSTTGTVPSSTISAGLPRPVGSSSGSANYDMLQSFIQRKPEGTG